MSSRGQKLGLIVQDGKMILQSESPVFTFGNTDPQAALCLIPSTIGFLRCGCPSVQWLIVGQLFYAGGLSRQQIVLEKVGQAFQELQVAGERFKINAPSRIWIEGSVVTIARTIAPNMVETTFEEVKEGQDFFMWIRTKVDGPSIKTRCVKRDRHRGQHAAMPLEGYLRGLDYYPVDAERVQLIAE